MADPFREIWRPHRYKVFYGGRGSGKSWAVAQALMVMCDMANIRILCLGDVLLRYQRLDDADCFFYFVTAKK